MNLPEYKPSVIINQLAKSSNQIDNWNINELITNIDKHDITSITLIKRDGVINGLVAIDSHVTGGLLPSLSNLHFIESGIPKINDIVLDKIINNNIYYDIVEAPETNMGMITSGINILSDIFIIYFLFSTITNILQRFNGGGGLPGMMNKNINSKDILIDANMIETRFVDIAGCDEAKYELKEIVDFLQNPEKYSIAGAKIPKGVLLEGPPGTGKTLLARAVAGESGVSFISISASEFIQMFVGVGAARVRNLFETARKNQPCVIFIDEIDAIGRKRGEQLNGGGNEEREQTLNQILTNMDGFTKSESIVVLAATNRADILDKALTRSGRFDRKITVGLPDKQGRMAILDVQLKNKHVDSKNTDYDKIAQLTSGFSGADIENMANEAIILALRDNKTKINTEYLLKAYEKITIGLPITNQIGNIYKDQLVAYHESGHTVTALLFKDMLTVRKVTINANTNGGGGYTLFTPLEKYIQYPTKKYFLANMIVAMGGRAAEIVLYNNVSNIIIENNYNNSILFGDINDLSITAGASQDLKQIDKLARQYIELFGIDGNNIIEYPIIQSPNNGYNMLSDKTNRDIEKYIVKLTNMALKQAINIILSNYDKFVVIADDLIKKRELDELYLSKIDIIYY
tara:strand:- start:2979 stop:4874 length:1896 start_codon:yes stop_codon:yes gene_type:complete